MQKWNLNTLFKNLPEWDNTLNKTKNLIKSFQALQKNIKTASDLLKILKLELKIDQTISNLAIFIELKKENAISIDHLKYRETELESICNSFFYDVLDFEYTLIKDKKRFNYFRKRKILKDFDYRFRQMSESRNSGSNKKYEQLIAHMSGMPDKAYNIYMDILNQHLNFPSVNTESGMIRLTKGTISEHLRSKDRSVRQKSSIAKIKTLLKTKDSFASVLQTSIEMRKMAKKEKYRDKTLSEYIVSDDDLSENQIKSIFDSFEKHVECSNRLLKIKKDIINVKRFYYYDDTVSLADKKISLKDAKKNIFKMTELFNNKSSDYYKHLFRKKRLYICTKSVKMIPYVGYSMNNGLQDSFIFVKYKNDLSSVMTLAHELGHAYHQNQMSKHNDFRTSDTSLIIHETVAFINEILLLKSLIKNAEKISDRKKYTLALAEYYNNVLFGKLPTAKLEMYLHKEIEKNKPLKPDVISKKWMEYNKQYYGKMNYDSNFEGAWVGNRRLLWEFYELKYVIAFALASNIAEKIFNGDKETVKKYNELMKIGQTVKTQEQIKLFGFDFEKSEIFIDGAIENFKKILEIIENENY